MASRDNKKNATSQIKVLIRCRPVLQHEKGHSTDSIKIDPETGNILLNTRQGNTKQFNFDNVFEGSSTQDVVYEQGEFSRNVDAVVRGFNSTVFAYGQTGTGKTYTMEGKIEISRSQGAATGGESSSPRSETGVIPRIIHELFEKAKLKYKDQVRFSCSFVQVYMEQVYDLLQADMGRLRSARNNRPSSSKKPALSSRLKLRWSKEKQFYLENMCTFEYENPDDMLRRFAKGVGNRKIASHRLNMQSSRSHSIFMVNVEMPNEDSPGNDKIKSSLMLVDLAGSERVSHTGSNSKRELLRESVFINQSLFALRKVITNLAKKNSRLHVPFRDSTLTSLLKNSLGGNAFTTMVACLTPSDTFYEENLCTLEYASRANSIVNTMTVREDPKTKLIRELKERVAELESELVRYKSGLAPSSSAIEQSVKPSEKTVTATNTRSGANETTREMHAPSSSLGPKASTTKSDYEDLAVETQNVNEALMTENADLREQLRFIQAIVTMEEEDTEAASSKKDLHTVETAMLMELFELRRENEGLREHMQRLEFGSMNNRKPDSSSRGRTRKQLANGKKGKSSHTQKKGMLTVDELRHMFSVGGSSKNVLSSTHTMEGSLGSSMRVTTTGNILETSSLGGHLGEGDEELGGSGLGLVNFDVEKVDPVEQLTELLAERNAMKKQQQ